MWREHPNQARRVCEALGFMVEEDLGWSACGGNVRVLYDGISEELEFEVKVEDDQGDIHWVILVSYGYKIGTFEAYKDNYSLENTRYLGDIADFPDFFSEEDWEDNFMDNGKDWAWMNERG